MQSGGAQVDKQSKPVRKVAGSTGTRTWPPLTRKLPCVTAATETRYFTPICGAAESLHSVRKVPHTPFSFSKAAKSPHSVRKVQHLPPLPSPFFTFLSPRQQNHRSVRKIHLQLPHPPTRPPFFNFFSPRQQDHHTVSWSNKFYPMLSACNRYTLSTTFTPNLSWL